MKSSRWMKVELPKEGLDSWIIVDEEKENVEKTRKPEVISKESVGFLEKKDKKAQKITVSNEIASKIPEENMIRNVKGKTKLSAIQVEKLTSLERIRQSRLVGKMLIKNEIKILKPLKEKSNAENAKAQFELGLKILNGEIAGDFKEALKCIEESAKQQYVEALYTMGYLLRNHPDFESLKNNNQRALSYLRQAVAKEHPGAMVELGRMHHKGIETKVDFAKASLLYQSAWEKGNSDGIHYIGLLHEEGSGRAKDLIKAIECYELAMKKDGNPRSAFQLSELYEKGGNHVSINLKKSKDFLEFSADSKFKPALLKLGNWYRDGTQVKRDKEKAISLWSEVVKLGHSEVMDRLATLSNKKKQPFNRKWHFKM